MGGSPWHALPWPAGDCVHRGGNKFKNSVTVGQVFIPPTHGESPTPQPLPNPPRLNAKLKSQTAGWIRGRGGMPSAGLISGIDLHDTYDCSR